MRAQIPPIWLTVALLATTLLCPLPAAGQQADQAAEPQVQEHDEALTKEYAVAQEHYLAKRYTEALPLFQEVAQGLGSPNAQLYVARCLRELGRPVEAHAAMARTVEMATERARAEERFAATAEQARKELADLEKRVGRVSVRVESPPAELVIEVAGRARRADELSEPMIVEPGQVQIDAIAPGLALQRQTISVAAGASETVVIRYAEPMVAPTPTASSALPSALPASEPAPEQPAESSWTNNGAIRVAGIVIASFGALGWATFAVAGVMADQRFSDVEERCNFERCTDPEVNDSIQTGRVLDYVANGGIGLGVLGTVAGGLMIIFGGADEPAETVGGYLLPDGGFVSYRVRF